MAFYGNGSGITNIRKLVGTQTFTSSGTWNKSSGVTYVRVIVTGGGGGGGATNNDDTAAGGGAGGRIESITPDQVIDWSIDLSNDTMRQHHDFEILPNGNLLIEGGDGSDFLNIGSNGAIKIADAVAASHSAKVAIEHSGINPNGLFVLSNHASFQGTTLQSNASRNTTNGSYIHFKCAINGVADKFRVLENLDSDKKIELKLNAKKFTKNFSLLNHFKQLEKLLT